MSEHIEIDGREGEGGGQILRTALALSCLTGRSVHLVNIRAGREKPGLMRQHKTCVLAAARVANAHVSGAELGSTELVFEPGPVTPGVFEFDIGSAGATGLVFQTVLWPLLFASGPSTLMLTGGTHVLAAPSFTFLARTFLPCLERMGARVTLALERTGYHPIGGGRVQAVIEPAAQLTRLELDAEPLPKELTAVATVSQLPLDVASRELSTLAEMLAIRKQRLFERNDRDARGPGNVVHVEAQLSDGRTAIFTGFGRRGAAAEKVALDLALEVRAFLAARVAVCEHLADQLLLPLALGAGGSFTTTAPSLHTRTNAALIARFLPVEFAFESLGAELDAAIGGEHGDTPAGGRWRVTVSKR